MSISLLYIFTLSFRDYIGECKCVNVYCSETHKPRKPRAAVSIISCNPATLLFPDTLLFSATQLLFPWAQFFFQTLSPKYFLLSHSFTVSTICSYPSSPLAVKYFRLFHNVSVDFLPKCLLGQLSAIIAQFIFFLVLARRRALFCHCSSYNMSNAPRCLSHSMLLYSVSICRLLEIKLSKLYEQSVLKFDIYPPCLVIG